ncbi:MAG: arylsulfatase [Bryobacterales bacterium]|nr:arylsulfatase [Bryobacterales bacterium]
MARMTRRGFLGALAAAQAQTRARPNIVLILTDDQGWWDIAAHGNRFVRTPHMDRLAAEGVSFERFYVCPVCAPTRAELMTGRYYLRTGVYNTRFGGDTLDARETTLPQVLQRAGYRTGIFGKWHLGRYAAQHPIHRGFDETLIFTQGHTERYFYPDQLEHNRKPIAARGYVTDVLTDAAIQFVKQSGGRPFFLYLPYNAPHSPNYVPSRYTERYMKMGVPIGDAEIYGMVERVDENIGRLLEVLDKEGLRGNTIVLFLSDNGGVSRHYRAHLRGAKASVFEGGVRAPLFVRWPGRLRPGTKVEPMVKVFDIFPTLCDLLGIPLPEGLALDGKSVRALLETGLGSSPHPFLCHYWDRFRPGKTQGWSICEPRFKLVGEQLFDLANDPSEKSDVSRQYPEDKRRLRARFDAWFDDVTQGKTFEPPAIEVGRHDENPVDLEPSWARLNGTHTTWASPGDEETTPASPLPGRHAPSTVNYTFAGYEWDSIDSWRTPGETVHWNIDVVRAGRYEVTLSYGCDPADAGGRFRIRAGSASIETVVHPTAGRALFEKHVCGVLRLAKGPAKLEVAALEVKGKELMALNRIWLRSLS